MKNDALNAPSYDLQQALQDRDLALNTYNECDPAWEAVCWHRYQEAEERVTALLKEARREGGKGDLIAGLHPL